MAILSSLRQKLFHRVVLVVAFLLLSYLLAACGGDAPAVPTAIPTEAVTGTPLGAQGTPIPTAESTPTNTLSLTLWWPEALAPAVSPNVTDLLNQQISNFGQAGEQPVDIEFRLKRYQDAGGILSTLRSASGIAPGALPDLTLIRRADLGAAVQDGLIYPLEGLISAAIIGDLYDAAFELGQIDGQVYGLPYALDVLQLVYRLPPDETAQPTSSTFSGWSFDNVLARGLPGVFPVGRVNGINHIFYLQYLDAGGSPPNADGTMTLNKDALLTVLSFYQQALSRGIVDARVLDYTSVTDYQSALALGEINMAVINSTTYLSLQNGAEDLLPGLLPTASGNPTSIVNGWMWVMPTSNADQQAVISRFLSWMMDVKHQQDYVQAMHMLPSQRSAMQNMNIADVDLMDALLTDAVIPLPDNAGGTLARAMQNALTAVLTGASTAEEAVQSVVDQVGG